MYSEQEESIIALIRELVAEMPPETCNLTIVEIGHGYHEPCFTVEPRNPESASMTGYIIGTDLTLVIGERAFREFYGVRTPGTVIQPIWEALTKGGFTERRWLDKNGKIRCSQLELHTLNGIVSFDYGGRFLSLFQRGTDQTIPYQPYCPPASLPQAYGRSSTATPRKASRS
jgi:hypothetical protein